MNDDEQVKQAVDDLIRMRDSAGWKIMVEHLRKSARLAAMAFAEADPEDTKQIRLLQNDILMFRLMTVLPEQLIQGRRGDEILAEMMAEDVPAEFQIEQDIEGYGGIEQIH